MRISKNVEMLELKSGKGSLYPVLAWDEKEIVLFDTGLPATSEALFAAVREAGFSAERITKIVLTHQDIDHIGNIKEVIKAAPNLLLLAHTAEARYIQGYMTPVKLAAMELRLEQLSPQERDGYEIIKKAFENRRSRVDILLHDNEVLDICGGMRVIHLPGHTPGHIGIHMEQDGIFIAGDALSVRDGELWGPNPEYSSNMEEAMQSLEKLNELGIKTILSYHGGIYKNETGRTVGELMRR